MDEKSIEKAVEVYFTLCQAIESRGWTFDRNDEKLTVDFQVNGEDLPMTCVIMVDIERQMVRFFSPMPFKMCEDKIVEGAVAVCASSYDMADGNFIYDIETGSITFKMTASFMNSTVGEGLFQYLIQCALSTVDRYNDKFFALNKGFISIEDFLNE
jgi:hypothetical protein